MINTLTDPTFVLAVLVGIAVFATMFTIFMPMFERGDLKSRMKAVAVERDEIRARERARLKAETGARGSLRQQNNTSIRQLVERLNLREALVDKNTEKKMRTAGFRTQNALNMFLFARFALPVHFLSRRHFLRVLHGRSGRTADAHSYCRGDRGSLSRLFCTEHLRVQPDDQAAEINPQRLAGCA